MKLQCGSLVTDDGHVFSFERVEYRIDGSVVYIRCEYSTKKLSLIYFVHVLARSETDILRKLSVDQTVESVAFARFLLKFAA